MYIYKLERAQFTYHIMRIAYIAFLYLNEGKAQIGTDPVPVPNFGMGPCQNLAQKQGSESFFGTVPRPFRGKEGAQPLKESQPRSQQSSRGNPAASALLTRPATDARRPN